MFGIDWQECLNLLDKVQADFEKVKAAQEAREEQEKDNEHQQSND